MRPWGPLPALAGHVARIRITRYRRLSPTAFSAVEWINC